MRYLALLVLLFMPLAASARTAKELSDACTSKNPYLNGVCDGYIESFLQESGFIDAEHPVSLFGNPDELRPRLTGTYTLGQFQRAFVGYLTAHPEEERYAASTVMFNAWLDHKMIRMAKRSRSLRTRTAGVLSAPSPVPRELRQT